MECNKEEAVRAKEEAESKMQHKEFEAARRLALRAQRLDPSLENLSQLLLVCNVHCSAEQRLFGNEIDWYGILQIEQTADEAAIKKQYRKLALQLHPDKNKFYGAEAAFKLIGEAQTLLLDKNKRYCHDMKRKVAPARRAPQKSNCNSNVKFAQNNFSGVNRQHHPRQPAQQGFCNVQNNVQNNIPSVNRQHYQPKQPAQPGYPNGLATFWTKCSFCLVRYEYYRTVVNKSLTCQACKKTFIAVDMGQAATPTSTNHSEPAPYQQKGVPNWAGSTAGMKFKGNASSKKCEAENFQNTASGSHGSSGKVNNKRRALVVSESDKDDDDDDDTDDSCDSEDDVVIDENGNLNATKDFGCYGEYPRRSTRQKQKVSYNEPLSDDDGVANSPKRAKVGHSVEEGSGEASKQEKIEKKRQSSAPAEVKDHRGTKGKAVASEECLPGESRETKKMSEKEASGEDCSKEGLEADSDSSASDVKFFDCPEPEFSDFDKDRREECFAASQVWAVYDVLDGMPRFYAQINEVFLPAFKLQITWLEKDARDESSAQWISEGLPVSCGKFKHGNTEVIDGCLMFSHLISCEILSHENTFLIYPRKGDVWAVFKNWNSSWTSDVLENNKFEYEFVEVLSDYVDDVGVYVAFIGRVKGFSFLFVREEKDGKEFSIPPTELHKFSHRIPSFKMTGEEREGVPKGSFELDPASLPSDIGKVDDSEDLEMRAGKNPADTCESVFQAKAKGSSEDLEEGIEVPDPEFHNFDDERSIENFQVGDIWSIYSDEDSLPKYYGQIRKIYTHPDVTLEIVWLEFLRVSRGTIRWSDRDIPVSCGFFKLKRDIQSYSSTACFSHRVGAYEYSRNLFEIFPRVGDVWALYRDWRPDMNCSELGQCEYDIVQVNSVNVASFDVLALERVGGFNTVFKPCLNGGSPIVSQVYYVELFRFSHQIPAFQLTDESDGTLRGYWVLDPSAFPVSFFSSK